MSEMPKKIICITGNIGSGKSSVTQYLREKKYPVLDLDEVVKSLYQREEVIIHLNKNLLNKNSNILDLKAISKIIFTDNNKREWLESYLYPLVKKEMDFFTNQYLLCFVEMALVFEKGWENYFDEIICVYAEKEIAKQRLIKKRSFTSEEVEERLSNQLSPLIKKEKADVIFINNEEINCLYIQIEKYLKERGI